MYVLIYCLLIHYGVASDLSDLLFQGKTVSLLSFILSFGFALYILPRILSISREKQLYDAPDARKSHVDAIPRLGGIVFLPSMIFSLSLTTAFRILIKFPLNPVWADRAVLEILLVTGGLILLYLVGAKDDLVGVRYRKKFIGQFVVAFLLSISGLYINNLYGVLGIYAIPEWIGIPLTVFAIVFITNAINLIDGIDGLAAWGCSISFLVLGILFFERSMHIYSSISFCVLGCLLPFAYYNTFGGRSRKDKMFMGDSGSLTLGFLLSFLCIRFMMYAPEYVEYDVKSFIFPVALLFIPVVDAFRVIVVRALHGKPLFLADRNHIHHKCLGAGMSHLQATCFLLICNVTLILLNIFLVEYLNINLLLIINILFFMITVVWLTIVGKQRSREEANTLSK